MTLNTEIGSSNLPCSSVKGPHARAEVPSAFMTAGAMRVAATDADELGDCLRDWNVELKQLQPGEFAGRIDVLPLGEVLICSGHYSQPVLQHVGPPEDCLSITRPGRGSGPVALQGHDVEAGEVFVAGSGADCETVSRGMLFPTALSVRYSYLASQSQWLNESPLLSSRCVRLHAPGVAWVGNFLDAMGWIAAAAAEYPDIKERADVCGSMVDTLLSRINTLGATGAPLSSDRETRGARRVAVERAREYIRANLTEPIRLSDLCKYARTQARSLEYGFHEVVGVSPIAYIRATRLHRVRKLLRSTAVRTRSVSEIALDCGFWHLSQFAVDYKRLFSESPSVTFRRTHAQLPRAERRTSPAAPFHPVVSPTNRTRSAAVA
jgi:AraC family ethanolamine operon transcriptional activator